MIEICEKWLDRYGDSLKWYFAVLNSLEYEVVDFNGVDKIFVYHLQIKWIVE
jgi:hypothetical protein